MKLLLSNEWGQIYFRFELATEFDWSTAPIREDLRNDYGEMSKRRTPEKTDA